MKVDFEDIFVQPDALRRGDIGRFLSRPVHRVFGFVFAYTQVARRHHSYTNLHHRSRTPALRRYTTL